MSKLYFCLTDRRDFGDITSPGGVSRILLRSEEELDALLRQQVPRGQEVLAIWSQNPKDTGQMPDLLVCADGTEEDWAAWITTFGAKVRPFSAYSRLITYSELQTVSKGWRLPRLDSLTWPVAGLILGEALAASRFPDKSLDAIPATACASTLSFAMFRAAAVLSNFYQWPQLVAAWESVRQNTRQRGRAIEGGLVARVCAAIIQAAGLADTGSILARSDRVTIAACEKLINSVGLAPAEFFLFPGFHSVEARMHGSREDRVVAFADFVRSASERSAVEPELTALMLGYLASRVAPGTIRHSGLLMSISERYPTAMLWYGFCAGLGGGEDGLIGIPALEKRRVGIDLPASARRVIRDLLRPEPLVGPPSCDISSLELMMLSRTGGVSFEGLITTTQGTVMVELAPGIWTAVNNHSKATPGEVPLRADRDREVLAMISECIERLRMASNELAGHDLPGDPEQSRLFPSTRRRKK